MRYQQQSKMFWKLGYRLFGGRFLHFMGGAKNQGEIVLESAERGNLNPGTSEINFAVPHENILRDFDPYQLKTEDSNDSAPGMMHRMIETLGDSLAGTSCCLTFDGKKLKQGLTPTSGDVDLLGFETGLSLEEKRNTLQESKRPYIELIEKLNSIAADDVSDLNDEDKESLKEDMNICLRRLSLDVLEIREIRKKKEYAKLKLIERCGEANWKNSRFVMAISCMIAYIHDLDEFVEFATEVLNEIIMCVACINGTAEHVAYGSAVNLYDCENYCGLETDQSNLTRQIKQRTEEWHSRRSIAKVTGSTIYGAIGLDGLKKQQDYFDTMVCGCVTKHSEKVCEFLRYGTENEPNATATLTSKVVPVLFPGMVCCEEGFVELGTTDESNPFMVVSPDGSIRKDKTMERTEHAVELKCPVMDIQRTLPPRYFLQCQSEIRALEVDSLVYLCWRPDFSSVFMVQRDDALLSRAYGLAEQCYKTETPKRPKTLRKEVKPLKLDIEKACKNEEIVSFVGLFPSVIHKTVENQFECNVFKFSRLQLLLSEIIKAIDNKYELLREKATEAVVFLCSTMDRSLSTKSVTAPVCWFTKGYSLDSNCMRRITEHVMDVCKLANIHIPAISFDGQWHTIAVRDEKNKPLTKLQLQKDVWKEVENTKKQAILSELRNLYNDPDWKILRVENEDRFGLVAFSKTSARRPRLSERVSKQRNADNLRMKNKSRRENEKREEGNEDNGQKGDDSEHIYEECEDMLDEMKEPNEHMSQVDGNIADGTISKENTAPWTDVNQHKEPTNTVTEAHANDKVNERANMTLLTMLKTDENSNKKGKWNETSVDEVQAILRSTEELEKLRDVDLKVIVRYLKKAGHPNLKESGTKSNKLQRICSVLGLQMREVSAVSTKNSSKRRHKVKSLGDLAFIEVSKLRKVDLNIIYAEYLWPDRLSAWQQNVLMTRTNLYEEGENVCTNNDDSGTDPVEVQCDDNTDPDEVTCYDGEDNNGLNDFAEFFYVPAYSTRRLQYEVSCIDSSHLLTRTRRKCCKGGLDGCSTTAWQSVAKSGKTNLSVAMTECIIDPMSVPTAVTNFSESVETEMVRNGHIREAMLCRDIRKWWMAEDDAGISARDRVRMRMPLRKRLLEHGEFGHFPPPGMYVNGWPTQLWEALVANIDAKTLLYALTKQQSYNTRAFSSLVGETFFSELTLYDRRGQGTVSSAEFQSIMGTAVEKLHIRLDHDRRFVYKTSRKTVYKLLDEKDYQEVQRNDPRQDIRIKDHSFDTSERVRVKGRKKEETVSSARNAVQRGALGVRWEKSRRNDSKLLPTIRMGIDS